MEWVEIMTLNKLKESVDNIFRVARDSDVGNYPVVVTLDEPSVGASACTEVSCVYTGFDFENGRINIGCRDKIVRKGKSLNDVIEPSADHESYFSHDKGMIYHCRNCGSRIANNDRYCRYCGQKLKEV